MNLPLSLAIAPYEHVRDLKPRGIDLVTLELSVEEIFYRFTRFREWDASEMSFGKVTALLSEDKPGIIALPVFPSRVFRHSAIYVGGAALKKPKDLEGKRVGIPEWAQTAGIYVRGMLAEEYSVDLSKIEWHQAGVHQPGRVEKIELKLPNGIRIARHPDKTLAGMLASGEIDAAISARDPGGKRMFENSRELEEAYFKKTRIFPIMHVVVLRRQTYERDRWIAMNLFTAFEEAKRASTARLADIGASQVALPWIPEQVRAWKALAGEDFWPYGVEPSRPTLEAFFRWSYEQGVARRLLKMEDVFAPETREQFKI